MIQNSLEEITKEYKKLYNSIPHDALELDLRITFKTIQALAEGNPVSPVKLADIWDMPIDQVQAILKQAEEMGRVEINAQGDLVGTVLSLNPTQHQISMDDKRFYAWCAYDAIYIPGIVGKPVLIFSKDPISGVTIQVSITPDGVKNVQPESAVVSVISPEGDMSTGPESIRCTHMHFFESRETAEKWNQNRVKLYLLTVEEVFQVAKEFQIDPARNLGLI